MKDIQAHLDKIRSDAAECVLLSSLVADGKGEVFAKTAEHLRTLASEVEKSIAASSAENNRTKSEQPAQEDQEKADAVIAQHPARQSRASQIFPWFLAALLAGIIGVLAFPNSSAKQWSSTLLSQFQRASAHPDDTQHISPPPSEDQAERKLLMEQLNALGTRVDDLSRVVDNLKIAHAATPNQETARVEEKPAGADAPSPAAVRSTPAADKPAASNQTDGEPIATNSPVTESVDRTGTIQVSPKRAEPNQHRFPVGPAGCTQFRSFDPVSGIYTTLQGRRRPCRY